VEIRFQQTIENITHKDTFWWKLSDFVDITGSGVHAQLYGAVKFQHTSTGLWQLAENSDITDEVGEKAANKSAISDDKMANN
jgi:hypothetical protein